MSLAGYILRGYLRGGFEKKIQNALNIATRASAVFLKRLFISYWNILLIIGVMVSL